MPVMFFEVQITSYMSRHTGYHFACSTTVYGCCFIPTKRWELMESHLPMPGDGELQSHGGTIPTEIAKMVAHLDHSCDFDLQLFDLSDDTALAVVCWPQLWAQGSSTKARMIV